MKNNPIVGKDMTQHALQCFERGAATWWRMYQTINGWQGVTTWKEFKLTLPKSRLVSQKLSRIVGSPFTQETSNLPNWAFFNWVTSFTIRAFILVFFMGVSYFSAYIFWTDGSIGDGPMDSEHGGSHEE